MKNINAAMLRTALLILALVVTSRTSIRALELDTETSGAWVEKYGAMGYLIAEGPSNMSYPSPHFVNAKQWVWTRGTAAPQAPVYPFSRGGIATCWYSETTFMAGVSFPDRNGPRVAFYFLDWDRQNRVQLVEELDAFDRVINQVEIRDFENGKYVLVSNYDAARIRIRRVSGPNAVLSGIFVGGRFIGSALGTPPTISPNGGSFEGPVDIELIAPTPESHPYFTLNDTDPSVNGMPYTGPIRLTQSSILRAVARSRYGQGPEAVATFTLSPIQTAEFLGEDRTTMGKWIGNYGNGAYAIPMLQPTMEVTHAGSQGWVWNWSSLDPSALQKPSAPDDGFAACWYNAMAFDIAVPIGDIERTISVYALDWDGAGRVQQIDVFDTERQQTLHSHTLSDFSDGVYLRWKVRKDVTIRVIRVAGPNAVLSGVFLDGAPVERVAAPGFSYGGAPGEPVTVFIDTATAGAEIRYTLDGSTPTRSSTLYVEPFELSTDATVSAIAFKDGMLPSAVSSVFIDGDGRNYPSASANFVSEDATTQGTWRGAFGSAGFWIAGDASSISAPLEAEVSGSQHVWAFNVADVAALQKATSPERLAACRYATDAVSLRVSTEASAVARPVSLYFLDWDEAGRVQQVEVLNGNGAVLDARTVSDFQDGKYLTWEVIGQVTFRITRVQGANAVVSGLFFD